MERFKVGDKVRVNAGAYYGRIGRIVGKAPYVFIVDIDGIGRREMLREWLIDSLANNGD